MFVVATKRMTFGSMTSGAADWFRGDAKMLMDNSVPMSGSASRLTLPSYEMSTKLSPTSTIDTDTICGVRVTTTAPSRLSTNWSAPGPKSVKLSSSCSGSRASFRWIVMFCTGGAVVAVFGLHVRFELTVKAPSRVKPVSGEYPDSG